MAAQVRPSVNRSCVNSRDAWTGAQTTPKALGDLLCNVNIVWFRVHIRSPVKPAVSTSTLINLSSPAYMRQNPNNLLLNMVAEHGNANSVTDRITPSSSDGTRLSFLTNPALRTLDPRPQSFQCTVCLRASSATVARHVPRPQTSGTLSGPYQPRCEHSRCYQHTACHFATTSPPASQTSCVSRCVFGM